jgi:hypothetical protein
MTTKDELVELITRMADLIVRQAEQLDEARRARDPALAATSEDLRDRRIRALESQNADFWRLDEQQKARIRDLEQRLSSADQAYLGGKRIEPTQSDADRNSLDVSDEHIANCEYP